MVIKDAIMELLSDGEPMVYVFFKEILKSEYDLKDVYTAIKELILTRSIVFYRSSLNIIYIMKFQRN